MKPDEIFKLINEAIKEELGEDAINLEDDNFLNLLADFVFGSYENTKIYDLYRRDLKYKDYINYKGGYKYEKIY